MAALTSDDLRAYVMQGERQVGANWVLLNFTHNLTARTFAEITFCVDATIEDVKVRSDAQWAVYAALLLVVILPLSSSSFRSLSVSSYQSPATFLNLLFPVNASACVCSFLIRTKFTP